MSDKYELEAVRNLFLAICDSYAEGTPLTDSFKQNRIKPQTFSKWLDENPEWEKDFEKAQNSFTRFQELNLRTKALNSFEKLVTGFTEIEITEEFVPTYSEEGREIGKKVTRRQEKEKYFPPQPQAVIFALQKLLPKTYADPNKQLPEAPQEVEEQVFKIGDQIIKF